MYRCEMCSTVVSERNRARRVVAKRRTRHYDPRPRAQAPTSGSRNTKRWRDDPGGRGQEIVREMMVCADCEARHQEVPAEAAPTTEVEVEAEVEVSSEEALSA